jgi:hypothetical protein
LAGAKKRLSPHAFGWSDRSAFFRPCRGSSTFLSLPGVRSAHPWLFSFAPSGAPGRCQSPRMVFSPPHRWFTVKRLILSPHPGLPNFAHHLLCSTGNWKLCESFRPGPLRHFIIAYCRNMPHSTENGKRVYQNSRRVRILVSRDSICLPISRERLRSTSMIK